QSLNASHGPVAAKSYVIDPGNFNRMMDVLHNIIHSRPVLLCKPATHVENTDDAALLGERANLGVRLVALRPQQRPASCMRECAGIFCITNGIQSSLLATVRQFNQHPYLVHGIDE